MQKNSKETIDINKNLCIPSEISLSSISNQITTSDSTDLLYSTFNVDTLDVDKLIKVIIKKHDQGIMNFDQIHQFIHQRMSTLKQDNKLVNWLLKNQDKSQYVWFLGLYYY